MLMVDPVQADKRAGPVEQQKLDALASDDRHFSMIRCELFWTASKNSGNADLEFLEHCTWPT